MKPEDVDWVLQLLKSSKKKKHLVCARHFKAPEKTPGDYFEVIKYCCGECGLAFDEWFDTFSWFWDEVKFPDGDGVFKVAVRNSLLSTVEVPKGQLSNSGLNIFRLAYEMSRLCPNGFYLGPAKVKTEFDIDQRYLNTIINKLENLGYIIKVAKYIAHKQCNTYVWVDQIPPEPTISIEEDDNVEIPF